MESNKPDVTLQEILNWGAILQEILESSEVREQMEQNGYFQSPQDVNFRYWIKRKFGKTSTVNTASLLSIDFWDGQHPILRRKGYYLIRSGKGSFAIFDEKMFSSPYLNSEVLKKAELNAKTIDSLEPQGYKHLKNAFKKNIDENAALEQLRFNGVYEKLIEFILGEKKQYYVGVRGKNSKPVFDVYFNKQNEPDLLLAYEYNGQTELDYTLWTEDSVFLFEAKRVKENIYDRALRIGWHKFAYAGARFINYNDLNIYPIYFLRTSNKVLLFVFPKFSFYKGDGVILNDVHQMVPNYAYIVNTKI